VRKLFIQIFILILIQGCDFSNGRIKNSNANLNKINFPNTTIILKNVNLIDGNGTAIQQNISVLIENGIIKEINSPFTDNMDSTKRVIDCRGKYLIPGLIESHSHVCRSSEDDLRKALYFGITSIRDMAGDGGYLLELKHAIENNELQAPDLYFSAVMAGNEFIKNDTRARISTPETYELGEAPWMQNIDDNTNIQKAIKRAKNCGATGLKIYANLSKELVFKLTKEAHHQGLQVWSHAFVGPANVLDVVTANVDAISHIPALLYPNDWDLKRDGTMAIDKAGIKSDYFQNAINKMKDNQIIMDATLSIYKSYCNNDEELMNNIYDLTNLVYKMGIPLVTGTDNSLIQKRLNKPILYDEIFTFVNKCGIKPIDAIKFATKNGAIVLGIEKTHGTIEPGKVANLIVLDKNPITNIRNIESVIMVIKNGRIIKSEI